MKNNINKKVGATLLAAAIMAGTAVIPMSNAALETAVARAAKATNKPSIQYRTQVQDYGWEQHWSGKEWRTDGETAGTVGQSKRMEAVNIRLINCEGVSIDVVAHVQDYGDIEYKNINENTMIGTQKEEKRIEAIKVTTHGLKEKGYKILYRTQVQDYGWEQHWSGKEWREEGEWSGTRGESKRLETIEMMVVPIDEDEPVVSTKMDYIKSTEMALTFNSDPSNYYYTLKDSDDASVSISSANVDTKTNQVVLTTAALSNGTTYTLTVKDKNDREIEKRTFTYRALNGVSTASIEEAGINAKNVNALNVTPSLSGANTVDTYVELTLVNSVEPDNKVVLKGTIGKTLVDTVITKNVSALKDGIITISAKVYDEDGNTTETASVTTTPAKLLKGVEPSKLSTTSSTRSSYLNGTVVLDEIDGVADLTKVYYKISERGSRTPTVEEIVKDGQQTTPSSETVTISASTLEQGKSYTVYMVTENEVGTLSDVTTATIAKDAITEQLNTVTDIKSNGDGTFSWTDNQTKTRGYIAQLTDGSDIIAETTVSGKKVDFSEIIKEQNVVAKYTVNVVAVGDYETINNSNVANGSTSTVGKYLDVTRLATPTISSITSQDASTVRLTLSSLSGVNQKASAFKIDVIKGVEDEVTHKVSFDAEKNTVYTTNRDVNVSWIDLNVSNYNDGVYKIAVSTVKGSSATDIALLDSNAAVKYYGRVATTKISNYTDEIANTSYTVKFAPVTVEGIQVSGYETKKDTLNSTTGVWNTGAYSTQATSNVNNSSLLTYTVSGLNASTTYKMYLKPIYGTSFADATNGNITLDAHYFADELLEVSKQITTKADPISANTYTVNSALNVSENVAVVNGVLKMHNGAGVVEVSGSNLAEVKALVEKLSDGDTFTIAADGSISNVVIDATSISTTRIVALGNTAKDSNLTVNGTAGQQVTVSGNIGKGTITLGTAGTFDISGLSNNDKKVISSVAGLGIYATAGVSIDITSSATINNVAITGTGTVAATSGSEITVKSGTVSAISAADNKTVTFAGTHSNIAVDANGTDNTITVRTADVNSSVNNVTVTGKVNVVNAYIRGTLGFAANAEGTVITDEAYVGDGLTITPVSGNVTITKDATGNYTVSGKAKVTYTDAKAMAGLSLTKVEDVSLTSAGVQMTAYKFATNNVATYTLDDVAGVAVIEITLATGTLNINK